MEPLIRFQKWVLSCEEEYRQVQDAYFSSEEKELSVQYRHLTVKDFPRAHATMVEAFADYQVDMSYMTSKRSWLRNLKSGVHYDCSVGAFDGEKLVGVTIVGLDDRQGEKAAFDAGTGIVPGYRGQGVAKAGAVHVVDQFEMEHSF